MAFHPHRSIQAHSAIIASKNKQTGCSTNKTTGVGRSSAMTMFVAQWDVHFSNRFSQDCSRSAKSSRVIFSSALYQPLESFEDVLLWLEVGRINEGDDELLERLSVVNWRRGVDGRFIGRGVEDREYESVAKSYFDQSNWFRVRVVVVLMVMLMVVQHNF